MEQLCRSESILVSEAVSQTVSQAVQWARYSVLSRQSRKADYCACAIEFYTRCWQNALAKDHITCRSSNEMDGLKAEKY